MEATTTAAENGSEPIEVLWNGFQAENCGYLSLSLNSTLFQWSLETQTRSLHSLNTCMLALWCSASHFSDNAKCPGITLLTPSTQVHKFPPISSSINPTDQTTKSTPHHYKPHNLKNHCSKHIQKK